MIKHSVSFNRASDHNEAHDNSLANYKIEYIFVTLLIIRYTIIQYKDTEHDRMVKGNMTENIIQDIIPEYN